MVLISVIIPTCNRNDLLEKCLKALSPDVQLITADKYEVIVSDDSKNNIAKELITSKFPWAKWIAGPSKGPAANRNNGASYATGKWLIFIDDDCIPNNNLLNEYINGIFSNKQTYVFEGCINVDRQKKSFLEESPVNVTGGFLWSCNFMILREFFNELQGFDSRFPYPAMEDVDLRYRILRTNNHIIFLPKACVIHPWRTEKSMLSKTKERFESTIYFLQKHPEMKTKFDANYFFRIFLNQFKNTFKYAHLFKYKGLYTQFRVSFFHLFCAFKLLVKGRFSN